jgi:nucleoid-associated protein YgaU
MSTIELIPEAVRPLPPRQGRPLPAAPRPIRPSSPPPVRPAPVPAAGGLLPAFADRAGQRAGCAPARVSRQERVFRRRRLAAVVALAAMAVMLFLGAQAAFGASRSTSSAAAGARATMHLYVVQPGDTLWGIAQRYAPGRDPRPLVAELASEIGGTAIQPGQHLRIP